MLTIQPKFTQYTQQRNNVSFKGIENTGIPDDSFYQDKTRFYEDQIKEFDTLIEDEHTPGAFKKVLKGFRVVSEGLLEGCAVAWGASKGAKVMKSAAAKVAGSDFTKGTKKVLAPMIEGFKATGSKIWKAIGKKFTQFKTSKFVTGLTEKFGKFVEKMKTKKIGKFIIGSFETVGKAFKWIGQKIAKGFNFLKGKIKGMNGSEVYDKTANVASKTLGAGAGVAGAYNAATRAEERAEQVQARKLNYNQSEDMSDMDFDVLNDLEKDIEDGE